MDILETVIQRLQAQADEVSELARLRDLRVERQLREAGLCIPEFIAWLATRIKAELDKDR